MSTLPGLCVQVVSDTFGLPVFTFTQANSAGLGAAYLAYWAREGEYVRFRVNCAVGIAACGQVPLNMWKWSHE